MGAVARRYARALFEVAQKRDQLDLIEQEIHVLDKIFSDHPEFLKFLHHPSVEQETKKEELSVILGEHFSETTLTFLLLLIDRVREGELHAIMEFFDRLANKERGLEDAFVTTSEPLSEKSKEELAEKFGVITTRKVRIHNEIDADILGGVKVQIGDRVYDGSLQGKLNRIKKHMSKTRS